MYGYKDKKLFYIGMSILSFTVLSFTTIANEGDVCRRHSDCSDGIDCTVDLCHPMLQRCIASIPVNHLCDDGLFCNGKEICGSQTGCIDGTPPCDNFCDEDMDVCESAFTIYEAENMYHSTGDAISGGWNIYDNGYISFDHNFNSGAIDIVVRAKADYGNGWPNMRVTVNGMEIYNDLVQTRVWADYIASFWAPIGTAEVRIYFTNDFYEPPVDRNLHIDKATITSSNSTSSSVNLGPVNAETNTTVDGYLDIVIDQLDFYNWTPSKIVIGISPTDNQTMDGMSTSVSGGSKATLSGWWQQIDIPFNNQDSIKMTIKSTSLRRLRTQWWATN